MISFLWPFAFALLVIPLLVRYFLKPVAVQAQGALRVPFFNVFATTSSNNARAVKKGWRAWLGYFVWLLLVTALARPAFVGPQVAMPIKGRDLMMAIDLSGSMQALDLTVSGQQATRLDVVKFTADDFLARRKGDKVGLILFSDRAYVQSPLTFDRDVVRNLLGQAEVGLTGQKTAIGDAIAIATKRLKERAEQARVLVLLTDGNSNAGVIEPMAAAKIAKALGIKIYTIGVGAKEVQVNSVFGAQLVNPSEDLDETTLTQIAQLTGGKYFRATDIQGLAQIYQDINTLEPVDSQVQYVQPRVALYFWPAGLAVLLVFLALLIQQSGNVVGRLSVAKNVKLKQTKLSGE
jgi:Ca-activated chloride channel family protein